ncbi:MAG: tetratricopeptide repeat protein [Planctomycetaceae bacterium]
MKMQTLAARHDDGSVNSFGGTVRWDTSLSPSLQPRSELNRKVRSMKYLTTQITALTALMLLSGCTTVQNIPGKMKSLVSPEKDTDDPLADVSGNVSDGYRIAKKELKSADDTLLKFARFREDMGDHSEALDRYREILKDNPDNIDARLGIARVEHKTGRDQEAEKILKATARKHPDNLQVWIEMGRIQGQLDQHSEAVASLSKAAELSPQSQVARYELGLALARSNRLDEALPHLRFAVGESAALYNVGYVLHESGRNAEATNWFARAMEAHPDERTRKAAGQMLAQLNHRAAPDPAAQMQLVSQPGRVDLQQTSVQAWRETPRAMNPERPAADISATAGVLLPPSQQIPVTRTAPQGWFARENQTQSSVTPAADNSPEPVIHQVSGTHSETVPPWRGPEPTAQPENVSSTPLPVFSRVGEQAAPVAAPPRWNR